MSPLSSTPAILAVLTALEFANISRSPRRLLLVNLTAYQVMISA